MNTKIITVALIVFALIFVVLLAVMMGTVTNKMTTANTQLTNTLDTTTNAGLSTYQSGTTVKGNVVISAINNDIKNLSSNGAKMSINVKTKHNTGGADYGYIVTDDTTATEPEYYDVTDQDNENYINPSAEFKCWQVSNNNGVICKLIFDQTLTNKYDTKGNLVTSSKD